MSPARVEESTKRPVRENVRLFGSLADGDDDFLCPVVDQLLSSTRPEISCQREENS